jgi:hypothetical protein
MTEENNTLTKTNKKKNKGSSNQKKVLPLKSKFPENMLVIKIDNIQNYDEDIGISYDCVIMKPNDVVLDAFENPAVYDFGEIVLPNNEKEVEFLDKINIPIDLI